MRKVCLPFANFYCRLTPTKMTFGLDSNLKINKQVLSLALFTQIIVCLLHSQCYTKFSDNTSSSKCNTSRRSRCECRNVGTFCLLFLSIAQILLADTFACATANHPDFSILAGRIEASRIHKITVKCFSAAVDVWCEHLLTPSYTIAKCECLTNFKLPRCH